MLNEIMNKDYYSSISMLEKYFIILLLFGTFLSILSIFGKIKVYKKANQKGYASIIPIYNYIVLLKIVELPIWYIILLFLPVINVIVLIDINTRLSRKFGLGIGFGLGLTFLPTIFYSILGFDNYRYLPNVEKVGKDNNNSDFLDDFMYEQKDISNF